ncbi:hypothetical protein WR25_08921 [Diploscapter pachys]|uniref:ATP-dependent NAD(P)H-hydrate dehydratase n=1 Tax=Diploscapter pachys TaxID=2018661 RepID=A0A2A2LS73_9BILA|nr:hypothetical protein WR25_08921 [Diploscapter pachys]
MDAIVVGPGLGRDPKLAKLIDKLLQFVDANQVPFIVDGDGLWFLSENITMLPRLESAILTPNFMEFSRLCKAALGVDDVVKIRDPEEIRKLAVRLSDKIGVAVFVKKEHDILVDPEGDVTESEAIGSPRRVGGQGDTTAGSLGLLLYWARKTGLDWKLARKEASMASSWLIRESARRAFAAEGRPMTTTHVIGQIANVVRMVDNK